VRYARKNKKTFKALAAVALAASLVVAPLVTAGASAADLIGTVGTFEDATPAANSPKYWEDRYADHQAECYSSTGNSDHGRLTNGKKTVTLYPFNQAWPGDHWEVLVVKAGNTNNVIHHPVAGVAYASPVNKGGKQAEVSHWIVCKGTTPEAPPTVVTPTLEWTPPSCTAAGVLTKSPNAEWVSVLNGDGTTTWTAKPLAGTAFPAGNFSWTVPNLDKLSETLEQCRPPQPPADVTSKETLEYDCASKVVQVTTTTTTTPYVWSGTAWVPGQPTDSTSTSERPMTVDEKKDCPLPDTLVEYGSWVDGEWVCGDTQVTQTREVTTTVFEYDAEGNPTAKSSVAIETQTRDLEQSEIGECPLIPGDIASSCVGDVPYLAYGVTLPEGYVADSATPVTITFVNPAGPDLVFGNQPLSGSVLWPGASAGEPKMWPGWELVNGEYFPTDGNFAWTREGVTVRFDVNPTYETVVEYPAASALCANPANDDDPETPVVGPETPVSPETPGPETPASVDPESPLAVTGGVVSPIVPIAGGALLLMGLAALAFVAYQRRQGVHTS
jgi:hypothetical protein